MSAIKKIFILFRASIWKNLAFVILLTISNLVAAVPSANLVANIFDSTVSTGGTIPSVYTWQGYSYTFTAPPGNATAITILGRNDCGAFFVDNVSVKEEGGNIELLLNGDFSNGVSVGAIDSDTGVPTSWTRGGVNGASGSMTVLSQGQATFNGYPNDSGGSSYPALFLSLQSGFGGVMQSVPTTAGNNYTLSFRMFYNDGVSCGGWMGTNASALDGSQYGTFTQLLVYAGNPPSGYVAYPTTITNPASSVGPTSATLNAEVIDNGANTSVTFEYGTTSKIYTNTGVVPDTNGSILAGAGTKSVKKALSGLSSSTTYYYRVKAANSQGTNYGSEQSFSTSAPVTYAVTYHGNGNTGGNVPTDGGSPYSVGSTVTVLGNTGSLTRTGYTFSGWNTAANGSASTYSPGDAFTISGDTALYAQWIAAPVAGPASATVPYNSGATPITLNITGGAAASVAIESGASHGTVTAIGTSITYTPTTTYSGTDSFTYTATNAGGTSAPATVTITVSAPAISYAPSSPANGQVGVASSQSLAGASGGAAPYTYSLASGSLPAGMALASNGTLSGTPTAGGAFSFTVRATDLSTGMGPFSATSGQMTLTIAAPTITVGPASLSAGKAGSAYSASLTASGGTSGYTYAVAAGSLPPGVSLSSSGVLSGTATAAGTFNLTVTATDSSTGTGPYTGSRAYSWTINPPALTINPVSGSNLSGTALTAYSQAFAPSGGTAPYTYGIVINSGAMPPGLSFNTSTGTLSGTPTAGGTVNFTVTATDSTTGAGSPFAVSSTYNLTIGAPTVVVAPVGSVTNPAIGTAYSQTFTASGGTEPYDFLISAGALPSGLTLNSGVLSGTPTAAGTFNFTVQATDTHNYAGTRAYSVTIAPPTIALAPATLPGGSTGVAYSQTVSASGGTAPYSYAVTAGALPVGLTLAPSTGAITGTPTTAATSNFTITATDSTTGTGAPFTASKAYTVTIASGNAGLSGLALSSGTLTPAFSTGTLAYTAQVANGVASVNVTPTLADTGATVTVNGNPPATAVPLVIGTNTVTVVVTAPDGVTTKTYTITLTRTGLQSVTGSGTTLSIGNPSASCTLVNTQFTPRAGLAGPQQSSLPAGYAYPYPAVDFKAEQCAMNSDLTVTLTFAGTVPANAVLLKYEAMATPPWQRFTPSSIIGNQVTYTIRDGGALDGDKAVNGEFIDPVILAAPPAAGAQGIPTLSEWALALLTALLGLLGWRQGRVRTA